MNAVHSADEADFVGHAEDIHHARAGSRLSK
jgi:hypothetical protein